jgi:proteasome lid subunit RPN8/RPN11
VKPLRLSFEHREAIYQHARDEAPRECCGVIAGKADGTLTTFHRLTNVAEGNRLYLIDDMELYQLTRELTERDEDPLVIYHSHPETPAYPSATDVANAFYPDSYYVICSLEHPEAPYLRAFRIVDGGIEEVGVVDGA